MAEVTNNEILESERFLANTESVNRDRQVEEVLQEVAEFMTLSADKIEELGNADTSGSLRDLANQFVLNKAELAKPLSRQAITTPQEQIAQQGMQGVAPPAGAIPPELAGTPAGLPAGV